MTRPIRIASMIVAILGVSAASAGAQPAGSPGRIDVALGGLWMGRPPSITSDANETTSAASAFRLFTTSTTLGAMTAGEIHVGLHIGENLEVFGAGSLGSRQLSIAASADSENAAPVTATERLRQFTFTGGALWFFSQSRIAPFLSLEAGNLRELHEDKALLETGRVYMLGGGVNVPLSTLSDGDIGIGVRLNARGVMRSSGFLVGSKKISPAAGVSLFVRF